MVSSQHRSPYLRHGGASLWSSVAAATVIACGSVAAQPLSAVRLSRYTTTAATPDVAQVDPLETVVQVSLPRDKVSTVGDAITYLLLRTGYRLAPPDSADRYTRAVLAMPLPEVHRHLGPYTVRTALSILVGKPYLLSVDAIQRLVAYRVEAAVASGAAVVGDSAERSVHPLIEQTR